MDEHEKVLSGIFWGGVAAVGGYVWLWPLTGIVVFIPVGLLLLVVLRRGRSKRPPYVLISIAAVSGGAVLVQIVLHGRPLVWWLVASVVAVLALRLLRTRIDKAGPLHRALRSSTTSALCAITVGLALVVAIQVVLGYRGLSTPDEVKSWLRGLQSTRAWLDEVVFLGPAALVALLVALVAAAIVVPSLRVVRSYRGVAKVTSSALLALTVATSFTFFTAQSARRWEGVWVAQRGSELDGALAKLEHDQLETVTLAALEDAIGSVPESTRGELAALAREIARYPEDPELAARQAREQQAYESAVDRRVEALERERRLQAEGYRPLGGAVPATLGASITIRDSAPVDRTEIWEEVETKLAEHVATEPIEARVRSAVKQIQAPATESDAAIDRLRQARLEPSASLARFEDLDVLGIERERAEAARREAYEAALQAVVAALIPRNAFAATFVNAVVDRIAGRLHAVLARFVDRSAVRAAIRAEAPPPVWNLDVAGSLEMSKGSGHADAARTIEAIYRRISTTHDEARKHQWESVDAAAEARIERKRAAERWERMSPYERELELEGRQRRIEPRRPGRR